MEEILMDLMEMKKKVQETKELENRYKRIFQELNVNNLVKTL